MIFDKASKTLHGGEQVVTVRCSLCGKRKGDGWRSFSDHVVREHTPADAGLSDGDVPEPACCEPDDLPRWAVRDLADRPGTYTTWHAECLDACGGDPTGATRRVLIAPDGSLHVPEGAL